MEIHEYQKLAARTLIERPGFDIPNQDLMTIWNAIGLAGEAGEVADLVKKGIFHQHGLDYHKIQDELGDVMWYVAAMCTTLGLDLSAIVAANIEKLQRRYPEGYSSTASINRAK